MGKDGYPVISSDSHVIEPPDLWTTRIESEFRDRCPRVVTVEEGHDIWVIDDTKGGSFSTGTQTGWRFDRREDMADTRAVFGDVRPGGYIPDEAVKDLDVDGVDATILYATAGFQMYYWVRDGELLSAIFKAYNDYLAGFCNAHPKRLKGIGFLNVDDIPTAIKEMERCAKLGLIGVNIPVYTERLRYRSPEYESLWAAAEDLDIPISLHLLSNRPGPDGEFGSDRISEVAPYFQVNADYWVRLALADMILSGVFERHPKLMVGSVEVELGWIPYFMWRLHYYYTESNLGWAGTRFKNDMLPADFYHRNVFNSFQEDAFGIRDRHIIGVDSLMWGSDYPHTESTFPKSQEFLERILADCTWEEKAKISGGNAARLYRL